MATRGTSAKPVTTRRQPKGQRQNAAPPADDVVSLSDRVFLSVSTSLKRGELPAGTRLSEGDLAKALEVSRTPVREALKRLEEEGLVALTATHRYVVADLMADAEHVFLIRERLEGLAATLAAQQITLPDLETLKDLQGQLETLVEGPCVDVDKMVELNYQFHSLITRAAKSPRLEKLINRLHPEYVSYQVVQSYDDEGRQQSVREHRAILDALWNRDVQQADRLVQAHLEHGKAVVLSELQTQASVGDRGLASQLSLRRKS